MTNEYTALTDIAAPGTSVFGYRRGNPVSAAVVENWGLTEEQVVEGDLVEDAPARPMTRPGDEANRAEWEGWAIANGMTEQEAAEASDEDLRNVAADQDAEYARPADSAKKSEWVMYVNNHPQATDEDQSWAGADSTTKADLQAWKPGGTADPIAQSATEANQA